MRQTTTDCASLHCTDPGDSRRRCLSPCTGDDADCPLGEGCAAGAGACGSCVPITELPPPHLYGEACATNADCASMLCQSDHEPEPFCTRMCTTEADCGTDFHCTGAGTCARGSRAPVGGACVGNEDCQGGAFCATRGADSWCTAVCSSDAACPMHFSCQPSAGAGSPMICVPVGSLIGGTCTTDTDCVGATAICRSGTCTTDCLVGARCAAGFYCVRDDGGLGASCVRAPPPPMMTPPMGGGCCATVGTTGKSPWAALLLARPRRDPPPAPLAQKTTRTVSSSLGPQSTPGGAWTRCEIVSVPCAGPALSPLGTSSRVSSKVPKGTTSLPALYWQFVAATIVALQRDTDAGANVPVAAVAPRTISTVSLPPMPGAGALSRSDQVRAPSVVAGSSVTAPGGSVAVST